MEKPVVFISYSHRDEEWKNRLMDQLTVLESQLEYVPWNDRQIAAGENWQEEIQRAIESADVAILLVTAHFLTSTFIQREEVPRLLARGPEIRIVPIIVTPCLWQSFEWLARLNLRPKDGRPLAGGSDFQIATDLVAIVGEVANILKETGAAPARKPEARVAVGDDQATPRSITSSAIEISAEPRIPRNSASETIATQAQKAEDAMLAIAASRDDPEIVEIIQNFREGLISASTQLQVLSDYKTLHDELHNLEFHCYTGIVRDSKHFTEDEEAADNLIVYERDLDARIHQMRAISEQAGFPPHEIQWLDTLTEAHASLREAVAKREPKAAEEARMLLNRVLSAEPIKINDRLLRKADRLDLRAVEQALHAMLDSFTQRGSLEKAGHVKAGIAALDKLKNGLANLTQEHDKWQGVEFELRGLSANINAQLSEVELSWRVFKRMAERFYRDSEEPWAVALKEEAKKLEQALLQGSRADVRISFRSYRRLAGDHFYRIDADLKKACGQMAGIGEPLQRLLFATRT